MLNELFHIFLIVLTLYTFEYRFYRSFLVNILYLLHCQLNQNEGVKFTIKFNIKLYILSYEFIIEF